MKSKHCWLKSFKYLRIPIAISDMQLFPSFGCGLRMPSGGSYQDNLAAYKRATSRNIELVAYKTVEWAHRLTHWTA